MASLTDAKVRGAKGTGKAYKLTDGEQLYLHVSPAGGRVWRMNYQFARAGQPKAAQKTLTIGPYPAISLKDARDARDVAKALLARGQEPKPDDLFRASAPVIDKRPTFEKIARDWLALNTKRWSPVHAEDVKVRLENDVFPRLGARAIADITASDVYEVLSPVVDRGAVETAHRICQRISAIFIYAVAKGEATGDPAGKLTIALPKVPKAKPQPAIVDLHAVRQMLVDCEAERCRAATKMAIRFIALTAVRPNELHGARWEEFEDIDGAEPLWRIPAARMKGDKERKAQEDGDHLVPLAPAAVEILRAMVKVTGDLDLVWPSERHTHKPMSENTLRALLIRAGYYQRHVPHGFRAAFSTIMNERYDRVWRSEGHKGPAPDRAIIDLMLAHVPENKVEGAYNRADYMERRREIACEWADLLVADMWSPSIHVGQPIRWAATGPGRPRR